MNRLEDFIGWYIGKAMTPSFPMKLVLTALMPPVLFCAFLIVLERGVID